MICICGGLTIKEAELLPDVEVDVFMKELAVGTAKESSSPPSSIWYSMSWEAQLTSVSSTSVSGV